MQTPPGSRILEPPEADAWERQATEALLSEHARELAAWSKESVVVAADIPIRMPRRHRLVRDKRLGEQALLACKRERLLLVVSQQGTRQTAGGPVIVDLQMGMFGAHCKRSGNAIFQHGTSWYRVVMANGRVTVLRTGRLAI